MQDLARDADEAIARGDSAGAREALDALIAAAEVARGGLPVEVEAPAPVRLPPLRHPFLLVLSGAGDASELARALRVDVATATMLAREGPPRVALRGAEEGDLRMRALAARAVGFGAGVVAREALAALPPARSLMARDAGGWRVAEGAWWEAPPEPGQRPLGEPDDLDGVWLVVPGEVEVRSQRGARATGRLERSRVGVAGAVHVARIAVVDLHLPDRIVRAAEGLTDLRALEGADAASARRSVKALVEGAAAWWPDATVLARKVCAAPATAPAGDATVLETGWPAWEEHSRVCRLHLAR